MTQVARPISTIAAGEWVDQTLSPTDLHLAVDDVVSDEGLTFITTETRPPLLSPCTLGLGPLVDPETGDGHFILVRARRVSSLGQSVTLVCDLLEGATLRESYSTVLSQSTLYDITFPVSTAAADAITDYTVLRLNLGVTVSGGPPNNSGEIDQVRFQCPTPVLTGQRVQTYVQSLPRRQSDSIGVTRTAVGTVGVHRRPAVSALAYRTNVETQEVSRRPAVVVKLVED